MKNKEFILRNLEYLLGGINAYIAAISDDPAYAITRNLLGEWRGLLYDVKEDVENEDAEDA